MKVGFALVILFLEIFLAACSRQEKLANEVDLLGTAAVQATQIIQKAQATALVRQAQLQATALMTGSESLTAITTELPGKTATLPVQSLGAQSTPFSENPGTPSPPPDESTVELISVGIGGEGLFIEVYFLAPPNVVSGWYQGNISVTDEASGAIYNEIPVLPVVGPLFGKPVEAGQVGYVMLVNAPLPLQTGAIVKVNLGEYTFEHIQVK